MLKYFVLLLSLLGVGAGVVHHPTSTQANDTTGGGGVHPLCAGAVDPYGACKP